jgi:His/Glu/Gln/Arg/opine family amino acid ABC transporter permease subunit
MYFDVHTLLQYLPDLMDGLKLTILSLVLCLGLSMAFGLIACLGSLSGQGLAYAIARSYVNTFRVIPDIVLIFWIYYCLPPLLAIKLPSFAAGIIALSLTSGAFMAESFRAGIQAVSRGQVEAALALGLASYPRWRLIILPPAIRWMMPALINNLTDLLKHTTLLAGIGVAELTYKAYTLGASTFRYLEFLSTVAIAYFIIIFPLSLVARFAELRLKARASR